MKKTFSISEAISFGWNTFKSNWKFWIVAFFIFAVGSSMGGGGTNFTKNFNSGNDIYERTDVTETIYSVDYSNEKGMLENNVPGQTLAENYLNMNNWKGAVLGVTDPNSLNSRQQVSPEPSFAKFLLFLTPVGIVAGVLFLASSAIFALVSVVFRMGYINLTLDAARGKQVYYKTLLNQVSLKKAARLIIAQILTGILIAIGFILIIPGIVFALKYSFLSFVMVDQDTGINESLKRSGQITKGARFKLFGLYIVFGLISLLGVLVFGFGIIPASIMISLAHAFVYNTLLEQENAQVGAPPAPQVDKPVNGEEVLEPSPQPSSTLLAGE